jgi:hypothetical protein
MFDLEGPADRAMSRALQSKNLKLVPLPKGDKK